MIPTLAIAGAAGFAAVYAYEAHLRATGQQPSHVLMKEILGAIAAAEADKLVESKCLDWIDAHRVCTARLPDSTSHAYFDCCRRARWPCTRRTTWPTSAMAPGLDGSTPRARGARAPSTTTDTARRSWLPVEGTSSHIILPNSLHMEDILHRLRLAGMAIHHQMDMAMLLSRLTPSPGLSASPSHLCGETLRPRMHRRTITTTRSITVSLVDGQVSVYYDPLFNILFSRLSPGGSTDTSLLTASSLIV